MKKLFLTLICLFVSFHPLNGQTNKWTEVYKHTNGDIEYIDFENIRQIGDYIYWYNLTNYIEPRKNIMSLSTYFKGDCEEMKFKFLNFNYFLGRMGTNLQTSEPPISELKEWKFPSPGMVTHYYLKLVCEFEKK